MLMKKKIWNQNLVDKYDDVMDHLYLVIGDILREKLGEEVTINYEGGETVSGLLAHVNSDSFLFQYKNGNCRIIPFRHMQAFPFFENNIINMTADEYENS